MAIVLTFTLGIAEKGLDLRKPMARCYTGERHSAKAVFFLSLLIIYTSEKPAEKQFFPASAMAKTSENKTL